MSEMGSDPISASITLAKMRSDPISEMPDDHVTLWRRCSDEHEFCCEIVQVAEGYFELRLLDGDRTVRREASSDVAALLRTAEALFATGLGPQA